MKIKTILDLSEIKLTKTNWEVAIMRVDLNIPCNRDLSRIYAVKDSVLFIANLGMKIVLISHYRRPTLAEFFTEPYSLNTISRMVSDVIGINVSFLDDHIDNINRTSITSKITLLENIRFYPEEEKNDIIFAKKLSELGDVYINEAFSVSHRSHASVDSITRFLPSFSGLSFSKEIGSLHNITNNIKRPYTVIIGGSKVSSKIDILKNLSKTADTLIITGAMANTFLSSIGKPVESSMIESHLIQEARNIMESSNAKIILPTDAIVSKNINENGIECDIDLIQNNYSCFDIGPKTINQILEIIRKSKTVLWNGALGAFEFSNFDQSSKIISEELAFRTENDNLISVIGGGETISSAGQFKNKMTYFSTAGGAFLDFVSGKRLPGIEALSTSEN